MDAQRLPEHGKLTIVNAGLSQENCFSHRLYGRGGAERVFITLLRHLDRSHCKPYLVLLRPEGEFMCQAPKDVVIHTLHQPWHYLTLAGSFPLMRNLVQLTGAYESGLKAARDVHAAMLVAEENSRKTGRLGSAGK